MKTTFFYLNSIATPILRAVERRGNFTTSYAAGRNIKLINEALEKPGKQVSDPDVTFFLTKRKIEGSDVVMPDDVKDNAELRARFEAGEKAFLEVLNLEIEFSGYKFNLEKVGFVRENELEPEEIVPGEAPMLVTQALARLVASLGLEG